MDSNQKPTADSEQLIFATAKVQEIPYGLNPSRDYRDVLRLNRGTCSGKHALLQHDLAGMGIHTRFMVAVHCFADLPVRYPAVIRDFLHTHPFMDAHNFLEAEINGQWITIDITWDSAMKPLGFETNENWDGTTPMRIGVVPLDSFAVVDPVEYKEEFLASLSDEERRYRQMFLMSLSDWLDEFRRTSKD